MTSTESASPAGEAGGPPPPTATTAPPPVRIDRDEGGVAVVVFAHAGASVNKLDRAALESLEQVIDTLASRPPAGVLFTSARDHFCVGADVSLIDAIATRQEALDGSRRGQAMFARLEALPCPTVIAIRGACLGGGLEWALACDRIVVSGSPGTRLGLPEVRLGILPGWGGTQRLPRRVGLGPAVQLMASGRRLDAERAAGTGLADRVVADDRLEAAALELVRELAARHTGGRVPPVVKRGLVGMASRWLPLVRSKVFAQVRKAVSGKAGPDYPAPLSIVESVENSFSLPPEEAFRREGELFADLVLGPVARHLLGLFRLTQEAKGWYAAAEAAAASTPVQKVAVLGAGAMGAGIAHLAAGAGLDVVLRDIAPQALDAGMSRIKKLVEEDVKRRRLDRAAADALMGRINATTDLAPLAGADLVVEAVIETMDLKKKVLNEAAGAAPGALLATNTSALSVSELAAALADGTRVAGLHFFNPVHRMPLVEVVAAGSSSDTTLGALLALSRRLKKTPVQVSDRPGFLVNRLLSVYLGEALLALGEGASITVIDRPMKKFGMPMGPLELLDQIGLDVATHVVDTMAAAFGDRMPKTDIIARMLAAGRTGRKGGSGFYTYEGARPTPDDSGVAAILGARTDGGNGAAPPDLVARLIYPMVSEAVRCLEEGVVQRPGEVDLAVVMGIGWPPFTGGLFRYADDVGPAALVETLDRLAGRHGPRLAPPEALRRLAAAGEAFYPPRNGGSS